MPAHRSYLFVPGNHARRVEKALQAGADAVILDLEDAVALAEKSAAREAVVEALGRPRACRAYVRVNAVDTDFCFDDLMAVSGAPLEGVVLPKVESAADLRMVDWVLAGRERALGRPVGGIDLLPLVETARGVTALREIATAGSRARRLTFGAGDLTRELGLEWTAEEDELLAVRSELVLASRLGELEPPLDTVCIQVREPERFRQAALRGRQMGCQGKLCIHPDQVRLANEIFTPSPEEVAWSRRVVEAFEEAESRKVASIQVDGQFVDYPIMERARRVLELARSIDEG